MHSRIYYPLEAVSCVSILLFLKNNEINYLIEYDGIQHFQPFDYFGGQIYLDKLQENDKKKECLL